MFCGIVRYNVSVNKREGETNASHREERQMSLLREAWPALRLVKALAGGIEDSARQRLRSNWTKRLRTTVSGSLSRCTPSFGWILSMSVKIIGKHHGLNYRCLCFGNLRIQESTSLAAFAERVHLSDGIFVNYSDSSERNDYLLDSSLI